MRPSEYERKWRKAHGHKETVSPEPEASMWDKLDALHKASVRPTNSFTRHEYMQRFGLTRSAASGAIRLLCLKGVIRRCDLGSHARTCYVLVEDKSQEEIRAERKK